jgi:hypothetical protein
VVCYYVGIEFDRLLATGKIVGLEQSVDPATYKRVADREEKRPSEVEISFHGEDSVSTLGLGHDDSIQHDVPEDVLIEMSSLKT